MTAAFAPAVVGRAPDFDRVRTCRGYGFGRDTTYRLRLWLSERVAMATEIADNAGASITNAIEAVAYDAEAAIRLIEPEPMLFPLDNGWTLIENYDVTSGVRISERPTFDLVTFASRQVSGIPEFPSWARWTPSDG